MALGLVITLLFLPSSFAIRHSSFGFDSRIREFVIRNSHLRHRRLARLRRFDFAGSRLQQPPQFSRDDLEASPFKQLEVVTGQRNRLHLPRIFAPPVEWVTDREAVDCRLALAGAEEDDASVVGTG